MAIFQLIRGSLLFYGIRPPQSYEQVQRLNLRNSMILLYFLITSITMVMFIFYEDGSAAEYANAVYSTLSSTVILCLAAIKIWKTEKIYKLMDNFEDLIRKRK